MCVLTSDMRVIDMPSAVPAAGAAPSLRSRLQRKAGEEREERSFVKISRHAGFRPAS